MFGDAIWLMHVTEASNKKDLVAATRSFALIQTKFLS